MSTALNSAINLYLPNDPEVDDPVLYAELKKIYVALRNLQIATAELTGADTDSELPPSSTILTQNYNSFFAYAGEHIDPGDVCYIYEDAGQLKVKKAVASVVGMKQAQCFCNSSAGVMSGDLGLFVAQQGYCTLLSGLVTGTAYYVDAATPGKLTTTKPALPNMVQQVGFAFDVTDMFFAIQAPVDQTPRTFDRL